MKVIKIAKEAERLNVPFAFVNETYASALREERIFGIRVPEKGEIIQFKPDEMNDLVAKLNSNSLTSKSLGAELSLETDRVPYVLNYLLKQGKIKGVLRKDNFLPDTILKD